LLFGSLSSRASCKGESAPFQLTDPVDQKPWQVQTRAYRPETKSKFPVVFVLPTIIGETILERTLAKRLCQKGMGAYVLNLVKLDSFEEQITNLNIHDDLYVRALAGVRHIISALQNDPRTSGEFGIIGASQGGMISTFIAGSEPLIKSSVVIVAGGNVPGILTYSDQKGVKKQRLARMKYYGITNQADYEQLLKDKIPHDPISVAPQIIPGSLLFFLGTQDKTVPTLFQKQLKDKIPGPLVFEMRTSHLEGVIKATTLHFNKISRFFLKRFNQN
jgi:dienelactone hydrolase